MGFAVEAGSGRQKKRRRSTPEMNVTPLVDVVLVLLIIFMVITPMMHKHFWVHVPTNPKTFKPRNKKDHLWFRFWLMARRA